jgi:phage terminase large subunit-like protein
VNEIPEWARNAISIPNPEAEPKPPAEPAADGEDSFLPLTLDGVVFPREASQRIRSMNPEERAAWDAERIKCLTDQLFLASILGFDLVENPHAALFARFLKKQPGVNLSSLETQFKKRMVLWQRGAAKTSCTRVEMVQLILNYPNIRICFLTGSDPIARKQLAALKQIFEKPNAELVRLFPEFCLTSVQNKKTKEWKDVQDEMGNAHEFTVPCRTTTVFADPTFAISTAKSVKAGSHYDCIFIDDLVTEINSKNAAQLEKSYQDYLAICPLLDPSGYIFVTGTRYSFGDAYERIQEQALAAGEASIWKFSIRDCYSAGKCKNCGHAEVFHDRDVNVQQPPCGVGVLCECKGYESNGDRGPLFPEVKTRDGRTFGFSMEGLERIKAELGPQAFANQYLNSPLAAETQTFTETMIGAQTLHNINQIPAYLNATTFVVGDLAYGSEETNDMSVLYVCRKLQGRLYVFDCRAGRWQSAELVDNIVRLCLDVNCRPSIIFLEKTLGADHLQNLINARAVQIGLQNVPIQWIKPNQRKGAKGIRIGNIQEALKSKRLFLYSGMPYYQELVNQLVKHPRTKHDDFADTLGRVIEAPTGYETEAIHQVQSAGNWLRKLHAAQPEDDSYPDTGGGSGICCG